MALTAPQIIDRGATGIASSGLTRDDVMTGCEVAELLRLPVSTVYYLAGRGEIPACRLGAHVAVAPSPDRRGAEVLNELGGRAFQPGRLGTTWVVSTQCVECMSESSSNSGCRRGAGGC
jgi:excisionase family DNA binding protein